MTPEELAAKLNDPSWVGPNIFLLIEHLDNYLCLLPTKIGKKQIKVPRKLKGSTKQRLAAGMSLGAPMLGHTLPIMQGHAMLGWQTVGALATALISFIYSTVIHDMLDGKYKTQRRTGNTGGQNQNAESTK